MWNRKELEEELDTTGSKNKKDRKDRIELFDYEILDKYGVEIVTAKISCNTCHHIWFLTIRNKNIEALDLLCGKCSSRRVLKEMENEGGK